jgi:hypothetical protein
VITEETIWTVIDSVKAQCSAIVEADRTGRALRARNHQAHERGEAVIEDPVIVSPRAIADASRRGADSGGAGVSPDASPAGDEDDLLGKLTR